jgi:hypothetical protein
VTKTVEGAALERQKANPNETLPFLDSYQAKPTFRALRKSAYLCLFKRVCGCHDNRKKNSTACRLAASRVLSGQKANYASKRLAWLTIDSGRFRVQRRHGDERTRLLRKMRPAGLLLPPPPARVHSHILCRRESRGAMPVRPEPSWGDGVAVILCLVTMRTMSPSPSAIVARNTPSCPTSMTFLTVVTECEASYAPSCTT